MINFYQYGYEFGKQGKKRIPWNDKRVGNFVKENSASIGSLENKQHNQFIKEWLNGYDAAISEKLINAGF